MPENERRKFLKASLASLAAVTGAGLSGCKPKAMCYVSWEPDEAPLPEPLPEETPVPEEPVTPPTESATPIDEKTANREDLTEKLKELGEEEPPKEVQDIGAMCYVTVPPNGWNS